MHSVRHERYHPMPLPKMKIYPGLRIPRLKIEKVNSPEDVLANRRVKLCIYYEGNSFMKQIFHILYYLRSMVENGEADGWSWIHSRECEDSKTNDLIIQFDLDQQWVSDMIYFTGYLECGLERYGPYAEVCAVNLGRQRPCRRASVRNLK
ncbi:unnamed protein product [Gongylonema pulchrum]|uniref:Neur_chan_LBD domain-containing protein n=1 Tax=Gongylonema pulchrum TaxID=637853 RepID=A0A183EDN3_9BILA|nr:unnamed protein product [Gongylonema pulchrum]